MRNEAHSPEHVVSPWSPLRRPAYRAVWTASVTSSIGTWMQSVGAAWLMTSLTASPLLVALMQTATSLPIFLVGLPAGTLADIVDRRKLLLITEGWMLLVALVLGVLTLAGVTSVWILLLFTFLLGLGAALDAPAWQAIIPELVERQELSSAAALQATGVNVARATGPALGGIVVAVAGPAAVFLLNAASFLGVLVTIFGWRRSRIPSEAPPEAMLGATTAGLRYVRHAPALQAVLVRIGVFNFGASALWALLPLVVRHDLGLGAIGYGVVLGSLGLGAVSAALFLPRLRRSLPVDRLTATATVIFAGVTLALASIHFLPLLLACTLVGGMAWLVMMSSMTVSAQMASPAWVRARALGIYLLVFQSIMAVGSLVWGAVAQHYGTGTALSCAALVLICGLAAIARWPLRTVERLDLTPSGHWPAPAVAVAPDVEDGPVLITIEYQVPVEQAREFITTMDEMRTFRRREGAISWGLFRDAANLEHYVETFLVLTWGEHIRQHIRVTMDDQALEARRNTFLKPGVAPFTSHLIDAHAFDSWTPVEHSYDELS